MKRWIIGIVVAVAAIGGLGYWLSQQKISLPQLAGKTATAERKTLSIPIKATGLIEPAAPPIEIKSKASGEVQKIYVKAGDMVRKGQLLLELDPKDERRNVERAKAEMDRAKAVWEKAKHAKTQETLNYGPNVRAAEAAVASARAVLTRLELDWQRMDKSFQNGAASPQEHATAKALYEGAAADVARMEAELERMRNSEIVQRIAEQDVALAEAAYQAAVKTWEDAQERLRETSIRSPIDGMIAKMERHVGEMIQSGTTSLTGGTLLMTVADMSDLYVTAQVDEADISAVLDLAPAQARPGVQRVEAMLQQNLSASAAKSEQDEQSLVKALTSAPATMPSAALAGGVQAGKPVKITVEAFREESFEGQIEHISPEPLRQQSVVTYDVRIRLTSPNRYKLLLGMQADAEFTSESVNAVVVPIDAVKILDGDVGRGERGVWVPVPNGSAVPDKKWRPCRFGLDDGVDIEVLEGLKEGEKVFTQLPIDINQNK